jgi:glutathione S-transferase
MSARARRETVFAILVVMAQEMRLIGMLDSPYVRRVAVSLQLLGLRFAHEPLSVFRTFEQFAAINPLVKAPTLVCDDGTVLMDSSLILEYAEVLATGARRLLPGELAPRRRALRTIGLALAACEKSVQLIYENMRPADKRHGAWIERVSGQLLAACDALEADLVARAPLAGESATIGQDGVSAAVAWHFIQQMVAERVPTKRCPVLAQWSAHAETLSEFRAAPHGSGTCSAPH